MFDIVKKNDFSDSLTKQEFTWSRHKLLYVFGKLKRRHHIGCSLFALAIQSQIACLISGKKGN